MPNIKHIRADTPHDPFLPLTMPAYSLKRGKQTPDPRPAWDAKDGMGKTLDTEQGKQVLDNALRD